MKMVVTVSLLFLLVADALIAQAQSKGDETDPFVGATIIGEKQVTAEIRITDIPEDLAPFKEGWFFQVRECVRRAHLCHARRTRREVAYMRPRSWPST